MQIQLQLSGMQDVLPGLEGYVCTFKCLTNCPLGPGQECYWDDPGYPILDDLSLEECYALWRDHNESLARPEPKDPLQTRCPRCFSTEVVRGYPYIECKNCGFNEPLIDFPISRYYHLALEKMFNLEI